MNLIFNIKIYKRNKKINLGKSRKEWICRNKKYKLIGKNKMNKIMGCFFGKIKIRDYYLILLRKKR